MKVMIRAWVTVVVFAVLIRPPGLVHAGWFGAADVKRVCTSLLKAFYFKKIRVDYGQKKVDQVSELDLVNLTRILDGEVLPEDLGFWAISLAERASTLPVEQQKRFRDWLSNQNFHSSISRRIDEALESSSVNLYSNSFHLSQSDSPGPARTKVRDLVGVLQSGSGFSPRDALTRVRGMMASSKKLSGAFSLIDEMIFGSTDSAFQLGSTTSEANYGVVHYISQQLDQDVELLQSSLNFYNALRQIDSSIEGQTTAGVSVFAQPSTLIWETAQANVWSVALKASGGNPVLALRTITVFGHDDIKQELMIRTGSPHAPYIRLLNVLKPLRSSQLYKPGSIPELKIPKSSIKMAQRLHQEYLELYPRSEAGYGDEDIEKYQSRFRAGYYHFLGGVFTSTELTRKGFGVIGKVKFPVFMAEQMGYFYKKMTMLKSYMSADALKLYEVGFTKIGKKVSIPEGWDEIRFRKAKLEVEGSLLFLELGAEQHRAGADWAFRQIVNR